MSATTEPKPRRIHVIGGMGSGKSTVAGGLGRRLGLPVYSLDDVAYARGGVKQPASVRQAEAARIAATQLWVTEGVYLGWVEPLFAAADLIVWLDIPWRVAAWRIVRRHFACTWAGTNEHPGLRRLWRFLLAAQRYYASDEQPTSADDDATLTRLATLQSLEPYRSKVRVTYGPTSPLWAEM